jgi:competence ComEA-like helix-hairpin-helix protein
MNGRERFASVILIVTIAIGILADVRDQDQVGDCVSAGAGVETSEPIAGAHDTYLRLDLNTAGLEHLMALPGIGPKKAEAIVEWRESKGPFREVGELLNIRGIGEKTLERIRAYIYVETGVSIGVD